MMEYYSPPIPLTLSFSPFNLNNLAGEKKRKQIILRKKEVEITRDSDRDKKVERFTSKIPTYSMCNPIIFSRKELKRDSNGVASRFTSRLHTFSSRNLTPKNDISTYEIPEPVVILFEANRDGDKIKVPSDNDDRPTWSKPSYAFDIIENGFCGDDGIHDVHSDLMTTSVISYSLNLTSKLDSMTIQTWLQVSTICMAIACLATVMMISEQSMIVNAGKLDSSETSITQDEEFNAVASLSLRTLMSIGVDHRKPYGEQNQEIRVFENDENDELDTVSDATTATRTKSESRLPNSFVFEPDRNNGSYEIPSEPPGPGHDQVDETIVTTTRLSVIPKDVDDEVNMFLNWQPGFISIPRTMGLFSMICTAFRKHETVTTPGTDTETGYGRSLITNEHSEVGVNLINHRPR